MAHGLEDAQVRSPEEGPEHPVPLHPMPCIQDAPDATVNEGDPTTQELRLHGTGALRRFTIWETLRMPTASSSSLPLWRSRIVRSSVEQHWEELHQRAVADRPVLHM